MCCSRTANGAVTGTAASSPHCQHHYRRHICAVCPPRRRLQGVSQQKIPPKKAAASTQPVGSIRDGICAAAPQIWGLGELAECAELALGMLQVQQAGGEQAKPQSPWLPMQKALPCIPQSMVCRARVCTLLCLGVSRAAARSGARGKSCS